MPVSLFDEKSLFLYIIISDLSWSFDPTLVKSIDRTHGSSALVLNLFIENKIDIDTVRRMPEPSRYLTIVP